MRTIAVVFAICVLVITAAAGAFAQTQGRKVVYIDSYHEGYAWSDGITKGIQNVLSGSGVELEIVRMDTKRNAGEDFKQQAAEKAKAFIKRFQPDVVIASDDNAAKYVIQPYYKDASLPFVFCGVNWDAGVYGFPYSNVTGMVEVAPIPQLLEQLKKLAKGDKIGYLAADVLTAKKEGENYKTIFNFDIQEAYVATFVEWKNAFLDMQGKVDMLIVGNNAGINDWVDAEAETFVVANTKIPTGVIYDFLTPYALLGFTKIAEEQGGWAAEAALKILKGTKPSDIPIAKNKDGKLILNAAVAEALGVTIPPEILESADHIID